MSVRIHITEDTAHPGHLVLDGPKPYKTGRKKQRNSHKIVLRTFINQPVQVCFRSEDARPITVYFSTPTNLTTDPKITNVQLDGVGAATSRDYVVFLGDGAWALDAMSVPLAGALKVSAFLLSGASGCSFDTAGEVSHVDDIIVDGGP